MVTNLLSFLFILITKNNGIFGSTTISHTSTLIVNDYSGYDEYNDNYISYLNYWEDESDHYTDEYDENTQFNMSTMGENGLRQLLFQDYNNDSIPVLNISDNILLKYGLQIESLEYFDQVGENIKFNILITQTWTDELLNWDTTEEDSPDFITVLSYKIWKPDLELYNAAEKPIIYDKNGAVKVFSDGTVLYTRPTKYSFSCTLNLVDFPFDTQSCVMTFGSWKYTKDVLDLKPFDENDIFKNISINQNFSHNEWNIIDVNVTHEDVEYLCCPGDYYPNSFFTITLKRNPQKYLVVIIMTIFITVGDFIVMLLPAENYRRTFILVFIPLTLIWLQIYIASKIPVIEYSTLMEQILFSCFVINITNAFESGILFTLIIKNRNKYSLKNKSIQNESLFNLTVINDISKIYYEKTTKNNFIDYCYIFDNFYRIVIILFFPIYTAILIG